MKRRLPGAILLLVLATSAPAAAKQLARSPVFDVVELSLQGPRMTAAENPTLTVETVVTFRHASGTTHDVRAFWDAGDPDGAAGAVWRLRFTPTQPGRWTVARIATNRPMRGVREGDHVTAIPSRLRGFWMPDPRAGGRWYRRSDGSRPYIVGNTHYDFLFAPKGREATAATIKADITANAPHFNKLRFVLMSPRKENQGQLQPFLDGGAPSAKETEQPNPRFFRERVDVAVREAFARDIIADLILGGTTGEQVAKREGYLRYVAARYGAYPNVWITIGQEWNEQVSAAHQKEVGTKLRALLPYPTPLSTHATAGWDEALNGDWADHSILQNKAKRLAEAARGALADHARNGHKPAVNDENGYDPGEHTTDEVIEGIVGTFLGGAYGTTGHKSGSKTGAYFWGHAAVQRDISEHPSHRALGFLRGKVDQHVRFWNMVPVAADQTIFGAAAAPYRALAWDGEQYVLGTNKSDVVEAKLPDGTWRIVQLDVRNQRESVLQTAATGLVKLSVPDSRGVLTVLTRVAGAVDRGLDAPVSGQVQPAAAPVPGAPLRVKTVSAELGAATVGQVYADDLEASGGTAPLVWSARDLPPGLTLATGGGLEGTPTRPGRFVLRVRVKDAQGAAAEAELTLMVHGAGRK